MTDSRLAFRGKTVEVKPAGPDSFTGIDLVLSQPEGFGLDLFVCGDQLRKGAALNAVQIAEGLVGARQPAGY